MIRTVRWFLAIEAVAFFAAALVHAGILASGYEHSEAAIAETVIGVVLTAGVAATVMAPHSSRTIGLAAQGFALLGTLVGIVTMIAGVGPRSAFDTALHGGFVTLLAAGLARVTRHCLPAHQA